MVLAFAGRRAQSIDGDLRAVALRIRKLLSALKPSAVVGAMSDGGDLLVVEEALGLPHPPDVHVILPTAEEVFREQSVAPAWRERFDRVLDEIRERGTIRSLGLPDGSDAYRSGNAAFLEHAAELATGRERPVVLVIAREGEGAIVEDLVERARLQNIPSLRIDPEARIADRPRVFVAMPYGKKQDPARRIKVDCDHVYEKILVPALEDAQLDYMRADEEIDQGVVLQPMIEWLATADMVIGDLETGNFNVGWELGLRHLMQPSQTLLIRPAETASPFDLNMVRHVGYRQDRRGVVSDEAAIAAWADLRPYLGRVGEHSDRSDSPVAAVMNVTQWGVVEPRAEVDARWDTLRQQLTRAREAAAPDLMLEVLDNAKGLDARVFQVLQTEAGVGLVRLGRYADARRLLRPVVDDDPDVTRPNAHVNYAIALYRPSDATIESFDAADDVLARVLVKRPTHPEVRALRGAIAKRRLRLRENPAERQFDLRQIMDSYRYDYERDLNAYYEGINVVAAAVALHLAYADEPAGERARQLLPAVRVAATLAWQSAPDDYWAAATVAESALYESLLAAGDDLFVDAYHAAGALRPPRGDIDATLFQLDFLRTLGLPEEPLTEARRALLAGAGVPDPAHA